MKYYITASLKRPPIGEEIIKMPVKGGAMYAGRIKAVVCADTWQEALEQGKEMILGCLKAETVGEPTPCQWGWMPVEDAIKLGDKKVYDSYPSATWLRYYRLRAGMTQQMLADAVGMNIRQIRKVELGEIEPGNLTAKNLLALAKVLGVLPELLV